MRMRREPMGLAKALLASVCLLLGACQDRLAGTSTSVGNTLEGIAALSDGTPAAGAVVTARSGEILIAEGRPQSRLLAATVADESGKFRLDFPSFKDFYLEIKGCLNDSCQASNFPERYFRHFPDSLSGIARLGTLRLGPSGSLTGTLVNTWAAPTTVTWVGLRGSDNFVQALVEPGNLSRKIFYLSAPYPAEYQLTVISHPGGVLSDPEPEAKELDVALDVKPWTVRDLGDIQLP